MLDKSKGLTKKALEKLSESIRIYTYLMITSQVADRNGYKSVDFKSIFNENFENMINRSDDIQQDIKQYQDILKYSRLSVDYNIANGVYMCPSNMIIKSDSINNYNNKLLISNNLKIGHVLTNNEKLEHNTKKVGHKTTRLHTIRL